MCGVRLGKWDVREHVRKVGFSLRKSRFNLWDVREYVRKVRFSLIQLMGCKRICKKSRIWLVGSKSQLVGCKIWHDMCKVMHVECKIEVMSA